MTDVRWVTARHERVGHQRTTLPARHFPGRIVLVDPDHFRVEDVGGADVVIWRFADVDWLAEGQAEAMARVRAAGSVVLIDADDHYLYNDEPKMTPAVKAAAGVLDYEGAARSREGYLACLSIADGALVSTPTLAATLEGLTPRVWVCPNFQDPDEWPTHPAPRSGPFTAGFIGSWGHRADLCLIRDAMAWAAEHGEAVLGGQVNPAEESFDWADLAQADLILRHTNVLLRGRPSLELIEAALNGGEREAREALRLEALMKANRRLKRRVAARRAAWSFGYRHAPWTDVETYQHNLARLDVGLCPIVPNEYGNCRSDSKLMEYAMAGVLPIVSDVPPYEEWKGTPVLFARDAAEYLEHVRWAAANRDEVYERAMAVRELVLRDRVVPAAIEPWRVAVAETLG